MGHGMKAIWVASLAVILAVTAAASAQACGYGRSGQGGSPRGDRYHNRGDDSEPRTYMSPEGTTTTGDGRPYYHPDAERDRYLRDLRRYNNLPWYQQWRERPPEYDRARRGNAAIGG